MSSKKMFAVNANWLNFVKNATSVNADHLRG